MNTLTLAAKTASIETIAADWNGLISEAKNFSESKIKLVNLGRRVGLGLQELCGHQQIGFSFFAQVQAQLPKTLTFEAAKKCVKLANVMPEPAQTMLDAHNAEQLLLEATGIIEEPKRIEAQTSREVAPATFFHSTLSDARDKILKRISEWDLWDDDTREGVRREIERAESWIAEVKRQLV